MHEADGYTFGSDTDSCQKEPDLGDAVHKYEYKVGCGQNGGGNCFPSPTYRGGDARNGSDGPGDNSEKKGNSTESTWLFSKTYPRRVEGDGKGRHC